MFSGEITNKSGKVIAQWLFTDRHAGLSSAPFDSLNLATHVGDAPLAVAANRSIAADQLSVPASDVTWPGLVHGTDIGVITQPLSLFPNVDILVTAKSKRVLATLGADCVPLIAVDPEAQVTLTAHIGWRGAADSIHESIAQAITSQGGKLSQTQVMMGPAICGHCYEVDEQRFLEVTSVLSEAGIMRSESSYGVDIRKGLAAKLRSMGMKVSVVDVCTFESSDYFSHRRDGQTGRQAGLVVLK